MGLAYFATPSEALGKTVDDGRSVQRVTDVDGDHYVVLQDGSRRHIHAIRPSTGLRCLCHEFVDEITEVIITEGNDDCGYSPLTGTGPGPAPRVVNAHCVATGAHCAYPLPTSSIPAYARIVRFDLREEFTPGPLGLVGPWRDRVRHLRVDHARSVGLPWR